MVILEVLATRGGLDPCKILDRFDERGMNIRDSNIGLLQLKNLYCICGPVAQW